MPLITDTAVNRLITRNINLQFQNITTTALQIEYILENQTSLINNIFAIVRTAAPDLDDNDIKDTIRQKLNERLQELLKSIEYNARMTDIALNRWNDIARNRFRQALPGMLEALMRSDHQAFSTSLITQRTQLETLQLGLGFVNTDDFRNYLSHLIQLTNLGELQNNPEIIRLRAILQNFLNHQGYDENVIQNIRNIPLELAPLPTEEQLGIRSGDTSSFGASDNSDNEESNSEEYELDVNIVIPNASAILSEHLKRISNLIEIFQASRLLDLLERLSQPQILSDEESVIANNVFTVYTDILRAIQQNHLVPIGQTRSELAALIQQANNVLTEDHPILQFAQTLIERGYCSQDMTLRAFRSDAEKSRILNNITSMAFDARMNNTMPQIQDLSARFTQLLLQLGTRILQPADFAQPETNTLRGRTDTRERLLIQLLFDQMRLRYRAEIIPAFFRIQQDISHYHRDHIAIFLQIGELVRNVQEQLRKQASTKSLTIVGRHRHQRRDRDGSGEGGHAPSWQIAKPGGRK